ncbi:hypothetical protein HX837_07895 [Marine Group I thaumarchaeote]|uniref:Outer membrane protein beta-barrel domain-containing protein n=1 Tax=Marine Group I thaumarchaeote TaxID=2511932 RepID=A0A7K4MR83_9ARCH|nr:hypothetical protein [Marine Group I thaumarchaeote]
MKKIIQSFLPIFILSSQVFAIAGFGLQVGQSTFSVDKSTSPLLIDNPAGGDQLNVGSFTQNSFSNGYGVGGYLYIDAIPVIDIDIEGSIMGSLYDFSFANVVDTVDQQFGWGAASGYITLQKKIFKLNIPLLAKTKLSAGVGINKHTSTPMIDQSMLEAVISGGDLENGNLDTDELITYLDNNKISASGFHIQAGLQFKLLMLDSFLFYRHVIVDDLIPGAKGFGSLNLRLGMGF